MAKKRQEERSNETRERILMACRVVFSQQGILGASLKDIEKQAGLPRALIYYHFGSLENIVVAITKQNLERARQLIQQKVVQANQEGNYSPKHLRETVLSLLRLVEEITFGPGKAMSIHVWSTALVNDEIRTVMQDMFAGIRQDLAKALELHSDKLKANAKRRRQTAVSLFSLIIPAYIVQRLFSDKQALEPEAFLAAYETLFDALKEKSK